MMAGASGKRVRLLAAFTLIEMMVVLIIMAVMAALAAPQLGRFYRNVKMKSAVNDFHVLLDSARRQSAINGKPYRVVVSPGWREAHVETRASKPVSDPEAAVKYIRELDKAERGVDPGGFSPFLPCEGVFASMRLPDGISFAYIAVDGRKMSPLQPAIELFSPYERIAQADYAFKSSTGDWKALRVAAGSGLVDDLQVVGWK